MSRYIVTDKYTGEIVGTGWHVRPRRRHITPQLVRDFTLAAGIALALLLVR